MKSAFLSKILASVGALLLANSFSVNGAQITVTNLTDHATTPVPGSFRKSLIDAADGDEIILAVTGTITLAGAELLVDKDVKITGPGSAQLAVSGNNASRVFNIPQGKIVAISGITIRNGRTLAGIDDAATPQERTGQAGGGVYSLGSLTLTDCDIISCASGAGGKVTTTGSAGSGGSGGAIFASGGALNLLRVRLNGNTTGHGGDWLIAEFGASGSGGSGGNGGALCCSSVQLSMIACTVAGNATGNGGEGQKRNGNQIPGAGFGGSGGGIFIVGGTTIVERCGVSSNVTGAGALGYLYGGAGGSGGGMYSSGGTTLINGCTVNSNVTGVGGNGIQYGGNGGSGGGLYIRGGDASLVNTTISGNRTAAGGTPENIFSGELAGLGGGIISNSNAALSATSCTITNNSRPSNATSGGAGIRVDSGTLTLNNTIVAGNPMSASAANSGQSPDVGGAFTSAGYNLIGAWNSQLLSTDKSGTLAARLDPLLNALADNGGPTLSHLPKRNSPAIDTGDDSITGVDQRGYERRLGPHVDIGSVELSEAAVLQLELGESTVTEGIGNVAVKVIRTGDMSGPASVNFATANGTATAGSDYIATSGTLQFSAGETEKTISVAVLDDPNPEGNETFSLTIFTPSANATLGALVTHSVTIQNDDSNAVIGFALAGSSLVESAGKAEITVVRSANTAIPVSVSYVSANGTALAGSDYAAVSGMLNFAAGETQKTIPVAILDDPNPEADETFSVTISAPSPNATLGAMATHFVTIQNDDADAVIEFSTASGALAESAGPAQIVVVRSGNTAIPVSVSYSTTNVSALAGSDYTAVSGTLNFAANETEKIIAVAILDDANFEPDETFSAMLSSTSANVTLGANTFHGVTIQNDDTPAIIQFKTATSLVFENAESASVLIERSGNNLSEASIQFATADGSATSESDYQSIAGTLTFAAGETQKAILIPLLADSVDEEDEFFSIVLSNPSVSALLSDSAEHTVALLDVSRPRVRGSFCGLLEERDGTGRGLVKFSITPGDKATGRISINGETHVLKARIGTDGRFAFSKVGKYLLSAEVSPDARIISGHLTTVETTDYLFTAEAAAPGRADNPVPQAAKWTAVLRSDLPSGFTCVKVTPGGRVRLAGMLPDGEIVATSSQVGSGGGIPIFIPHYMKKSGWLAGVAAHAPAGMLPMSGDFLWRKPKTFYGPAAEGLALELTGARYVPPKVTRLLDDFDYQPPNGRIHAGSLNLKPGAPNPAATFILRNNSTAAMLPNNPLRVKLTFLPASGKFTGKFNSPSGGSRKFQGVCIQQDGPDNDIAEGYYVGRSRRGDLLDSGGVQIVVGEP